MSKVKGRKGRATKSAWNRDWKFFADPSNSTGSLARIAFRRFARALENRTLTQGVSSGQWRFLREIWIEDGITQRELSGRVFMREPTTVVALRSLEKSGFIRRERDQEDRRRIRVYLTDKARKSHDKLMPFVAEVNAIVGKGLSCSEIETAHHVLTVTAENLAAEASKTEK